jgi:hypothetical protein
VGNCFAGEEIDPMRRIFFNSRGLRAGWRLLIFIGIFVGVESLTDWVIPTNHGLAKFPTGQERLISTKGMETLKRVTERQCE